MPKINKRILLIGLIIFALVLLLFLKEFNRFRSIIVSPNSTPLISPNAIDIPNDATDQIYGNPGSSITVVQFAGLGCKKCHENFYTITKFIDENPSQVRLIWKDAPLGGLFSKGNYLAHQAAYCAGKQKKFWEFIRVAMQDKNNLTPNGLNKAASGLGLNMDAWQTCLNSDEAKQKIEASLALVASLKINSVPIIFINNHLINPDENIDLTQMLRSTIKQ
jgi:protein-disulfide isomerase